VASGRWNGQAAVLGFVSAAVPTTTNPQQQSADRLVRGHQRKLHSAAPPLAHAGPDLRTYAVGGCTRVAVVASTAPPNFEYLSSWKDPRQARRAEMVADLCAERRAWQELTICCHPLPNEALDHVAAASRVQDFPRRRHRAETRDIYPSIIPKGRMGFLSETARRFRTAVCSTSTTSMSAPSTTATDPRTFLNGIPADRGVHFHMPPQPYGHPHIDTPIIPM